MRSLSRRAAAKPLCLLDRTVKFLAFQKSMSLLVMSRLEMTMTVPPETIIAGGVASPIGMPSFPSMKAVYSEWVGDNPNVSRTQIEILIADKADVFITIPNVIVRNIHGPRSRSISRGWWSFDHHWLKDHPSIWFNSTTRSQPYCRCCS
jgi:hypothetical protein